MSAQRVPDPEPGPLSGAEVFRHLALCYRSGAELLDVVAPLVTAAVEDGERVWVAVDAATRGQLEQRLGGVATGAVVFGDLVETYSYSGQTTAACRAERLREATAAGGRATVLSHASVLTDRDDTYWAEVDACCNIALTGAPVTLICLYEVDGAADGPGGVANRNHPELQLGATVRLNPGCTPPEEVLAAIPVPPAPPLGSPTQELTFGTAGSTGLRGIRAAATRHGLLAGLDAARTEGLVLAVTELVSNSIEHGAGHGTLSWWTAQGRAIAQIDDPGRIGVSPPGLRRPDSAGVRGRGVWLARRLSDVLHIWSTPDGTHVRIEMGREE